MRPRDTLLLAPALVIGVGMTIEASIGARWAEFVPFAMTPLSAGPILAYVLLEWRRPATAPADRWPIRHDE